MSLEYIRDYYRVPAFRGTRVLVRGKEATITGSRAAYVLIRVAGEKRSRVFHPTDPALTFIRGTGRARRGASRSTP